jgi:F-type H+/Na+-transporting ATPase subunit alpha
VIETKANDISAYIPTNVISITDGQVFLETDLFYQGIRPAVNAGTSVSRVGGDAQIKAMKKIAGPLRLNLAQYRDLAAFAEFGSDLDAASLAQLERGRRVVEVLKQPQYQPMAVEEQVVAIYAVTEGFMDKVAVGDVQRFERGLLEHMRNRFGDVLDTIRDTGEIGDAGRLREAIQAYVDGFLAEAKEG